MSKNKANPKDLLGIKKPPIHLIPPVALAHEAMAMKDGGIKYGPYNWRTNSVIATIYISAAMRHLLALLDGEDYADDSGVHHAAHARACMGIFLDAFFGGNLIDDRPVKGTYSEQAKSLEVKKEDANGEVAVTNENFKITIT